MLEFIKTQIKNKFQQNQKRNTFNKPYPTSFNKTPAKTMEPETRAFSGILGNHELTKNVSIFAKNTVAFHTVRPTKLTRTKKLISHDGNINCSMRSPRL